jgi:hypothetical protein
MLTDDEIFLAIDDVPITKDYVVAVGRAIAAKVLEKLRPAEPLAVIGALERAAQLLEDQASTLVDAHDYICIYPEGDAKSLRDALEVFTRIGTGPSGVTGSLKENDRA